MTWVITNIRIASREGWYEIFIVIYFIILDIGYKTIMIRSYLKDKLLLVLGFDDTVPLNY